MSSAAKPSRSSATSEVLNEGVRARTQARATAKVENDPFAQIQSNAFFSILLSGDVSPEERRRAFAQYMTATLNKEQDRARVKEFELFKEWLASQATALAQQIISLTNTETFAELQSVIKDLNEALLNYEDQIGPLMDLVDSVYQLRTNGLVIDAFREIKEDREREEQQRQQLADIHSNLNDTTDDMARKRRRIIELGEQKG